MDNNNTIKTLKALLLSSLFIVGCGKKDNTATPIVNVDGVNVPDSPNGYGPDQQGADWSYGATVDLKVASATDPYNPNNHYYPELSNLLQSYPTNNFPLQTQLNVNLSNDSAGRVYGHIQIRFYDNNQWNTLYFSAENVLNSNHDNLKDRRVHQAEYNRWFTLSGKQAFSGYFQGGIRSYNGGWLQWMSSVVLVVNNVKDQGDGQGAQYLDGEIWYKNLKTYNVGASVSPYGDWWNSTIWSTDNDNDPDVYGGYPERKCWFIYEGPLRCRSNAVMNKTSLDLTSDGYRKLGTFKDLPKFQAFDQGN